MSYLPITGVITKRIDYLWSLDIVKSISDNAEKSHVLGENCFELGYYLSLSLSLLFRTISMDRK